MEKKVKNSLFAGLLFAADKLTRNPVARPLHDFSRIFYRGPFTRQLQKYVRSRSGLTECHLIPRHSVTSPGRFNLFRSDLDYSLVAADGTSEEKIRAAIEVYRGISRQWPMLGELEAYTDAEHVLRHELSAEFGDVFQWLKLLRKWAELSAEKSETPYHREKKRLAMADIFLKLTGSAAPADPTDPAARGELAAAFSRALQSFLEARFPYKPPHSGFLSDDGLIRTPAHVGWQLAEKGATDADGASARGEEWTLTLSRPALLIFLSLLPELDGLSAAMKQEIQLRRQSPAIKRAYGAVAVMELLTCRSVWRMGVPDPAGMEYWMNGARRDIVRYFPQMAERLRLDMSLVDQGQPFKGPGDFCILPWVALQISPTGIRTCCAQFDPIVHEIDGALKNIFNDLRVQDMRKLFLNSRTPKNCQKCVEMSRNTPTYKTVKCGQWNHLEPELRERTTSDGYLDAPVRFLDLRFSNLCNFACRTCESGSSSRWTEIDKEIGRPAITLKNWDRDPAVMEAVFEILPTVEEIHFAGGEPLLSDGHYAVLEWLVKKNRTGVKLTYNTNLSVQTYKNFDVAEIWKNFEKVIVYPSMDSIATEGEYIRHGFNWSQMEKNLAHFRKHISMVHGVVSVYNVFSILEQVIWVKKNLDLETDITNVYNPDCMSVTVLPADIKQDVTRSYETFLSENESVLSPGQRETLRQTVSYMNSADHSARAGEFKRINEVLDRRWKRSFCETFPRLAPWYRNLG